MGQDGSMLDGDATTAVGVPPSIASSTARPKRLAGVALRVATGLIVGLLATEAVFRHEDGGAFPLVNVFAKDDRCGVRLEPGKTTRVGRAGGRITTVRINQDGFRGAEWPAPSLDDVLVLGDSQSFGLGVAEDEAFPARLTAELRSRGRTAIVLDASVPTYGPPEYEATLERVSARRPPETIVVSINLLNDYFELERPNLERHTALDGWAVLADSPPSTPDSSTMVETGIQTSHALFALWRWQRDRSRSSNGRAPEGDFHDLVDLVTLAEQSDFAAAAAAETQRQKSIAGTQSELAAARAELVALVRKYEPIVRYAGAAGPEWHAYALENGEPTDQVFTIEYGGCEARSGSYQARFSGNVIHAEVEALLRDFARMPWMSKNESHRIVTAFARRDAAREAALVLPAPPAPLPHAHPSEAMSRWLTGIRAFAHGARIVVLAIPLDVQASEQAKAKRGATDLDVAALDRLAYDLASAARSRGDIGVDPTARLREVGNAAYLSDGHLSAEGQAAIAKALADALTE